MNMLKRALVTGTTLAVSVMVPLSVTVIAADADPGGNPGKHGAGKSAHAGKSGQAGKSGKSTSSARKPDKAKQSKPGSSKGGSSKGGSKAGGQSGGKAGGKGGGNAGGKDPAGNNGTVKITPHGDIDGIPQNTPHVGCVFDIEWYGFDKGADIISDVSFAMKAPTGDVGLTVAGDQTVFVGGDSASGAGTSSGFDGEETYTLSFDGAPHPKQGYHVKLTIHTPESQGADTKHKVFWVQQCEETPPGGEEETPPTDTDVQGEEETADTEVAGAQATARGGAAQGAQVPTAVAAGMSGAPADTGSPLPLLVVLLGALVAGLGLVPRRRSA